MSFSSDTKRELCTAECNGAAIGRAECYGLLLFAKTFSNEKIIFNTENPYTAARFMNAVADSFQAITEQRAPVYPERAA